MIWRSIYAHENFVQLDEIITLEHERKKRRLWIPDASAVWAFFSPAAITSPEMDRDDDEDPGMFSFLLRVLPSLANI